MGNCNCIDERSDLDVPISEFAPAAALRPRFASGRHHLSDVSATSFDLPLPHSTQDVGTVDVVVEDGIRGTRGMVGSMPTEAKTVEWKLPSESREDLVRTLQSAVRMVLAQKQIREKEMQCVEQNDPGNVEPEPSSETLLDPYSLLSNEARLTLSSLPPLHFPYSIQQVVYYEARLLSDNCIYVGQWRKLSQGLYRKGKGKLFRTDGGYCEGYWTGKELNTLGRIVYPNGDWYEGEVMNGQRNGKGTFRSFDRSSEYTGQWVLGKKHGSGTLRLPDGTYTGEFRDDLKSGIGTLRSVNGKVYTGEFARGVIEGKGKYVWPDGRVYEGDWRAGEMHGKGRFQYSDGKLYEGDYHHDKKHGKGTYHWEGKIYEGDWVDGAMHGVGYLTTRDKCRRKYEFSKGQRGKELPDS